MPPPDQSIQESGLTRLLGGFFNAAWYLAHYPDVAAAGIDPLLHFVRFGAVEWRDPNPYFDSVWYAQHYPDVAASGAAPLLHYIQVGAAETRNPHPRFDAAWYVRQHPEAAGNPLLFHLRVGESRGFDTERPVDIADYLPSDREPLRPPPGVAVDVVIPVYRDLATVQHCIEAVRSQGGALLRDIIVVDDRSPDTALSLWLRASAAAGQIKLLRNKQRRGFTAAANAGIAASDDADIVLLAPEITLPAGGLDRLAAQAHAAPGVAAVAPLAGPPPFNQTAAALDQLTRHINAARSARVPAADLSCLYLTRAAIVPLDPGATAFTAPPGWETRVACDVFVASDTHQDASPPARFALIAALVRRSALPVIVAISHDIGGGVRRHIRSLMQRFAEAAHMLALEGTKNGCALSIPALPDHPVLTLPGERIDDLILVLRSFGVARIHLHHLLWLDLDVRTLIHRLGVPFDVTVHDYYGICPQINLLPWPESLYCGEPDAAACNACIAANPGGHSARDILSWRRGFAWQFIEADRVFCPSADVRNRLARYGFADRAIIAPHEPISAGDWPLALRRPDGPTLRIVLLGALANHKGSRAVAALAEAAPPGLIALHVIGYLEDTFPRAAAHHITETGAYADADLPRLLQDARPDVVWLPSSAPETYSYTLSTAIAAGLPIVATDLGAFTERLAGRPFSWLIDHRAGTADYLAVFEDVRRTLQTAKATTAPRPAEPDAYAAYLRPPAQPRGGKPIIAMVPERFDNGALSPCAYIRLLLPLDHPAIGGDCALILTDAAGALHTRADIIVTQRYALPDLAAADRLIAHARATGAALVYDLDDDLLSIPRSHPDAAELRPRARVVRRMLDHADAVWVSTPALKDRVAAIRPDAVVVENGLDERIWNATPAPVLRPVHPLRILCMGTSTHDRDFALIEPALTRLLAAYPDQLVIDVLGVTSRTLPAGLNRIGPSMHGNQSYPGFVHWLNGVQPRWHVGLAPLLDTPFNRGKSSIKAMDYAALGLFVLASDTPVYRGSIADGAAGCLLANDPRAWYEAIAWMLRDESVLTSRSPRAAFLDRATLAGQADCRRAAWHALLEAGRRADAA